MRKIKAHQIAVFSPMMALSISLGIYAAVYLFGNNGIINVAGYNQIAVFIFSLILIYFSAVIFYRIFFKIFPFTSGEVLQDSRRETLAHVYALFQLFFFYPVTLSGLLPPPLTRPFYRMLGAKLGKNTYSGGVINDPMFFTAGANCIIGLKSSIICHAMEGQYLAYHHTIIPVAFLH